MDRGLGFTEPGPLRRQKPTVEHAVGSHLVANQREGSNPLVSQSTAPAPRPCAMTALRSIVYVSTASRLIESDELESLLVEARGLNRQNNITGVLLHSEGNFMQCFEGPEEAMRSTYHRILASSRHKALIELMNDPIKQRTFSGWEMGSATPTGSELIALSTAQWRQMSDQAGLSLSSPPGLELLKIFWAMRQGAH